MSKFCNQVFTYLRSVLLGTAIAFLIIPYIQVQSRELDPGTGLPVDELVQVVGMGDCSTSWFMPNWVGVLITDELTRYELNFEHEDVFKETYLCRKYGNSIEFPSTAQVTSRTQRGFFATFNDKEKWTLAMTVYFCCDQIIYVDSEMRNDQSGGSCVRKLVFVDPSDPFFDTFIGKFVRVLFAYYRFDSSWAGTYHLFERNCQHWAHYVLTGEDKSD